MEKEFGLKFKIFIFSVNSSARSAFFVVKIGNIGDKKADLALGIFVSYSTQEYVIGTYIVDTHGYLLWGLNYSERYCFY